MSAPDRANQNLAIRNALLSNCVPMFQSIYSQNITPANQNGPINIPVQNVGLIKGFLVVVSGTLRNTDGAIVANRTPMGAANLVSNFSFTDLNNIVRINTPGW